MAIQATISGTSHADPLNNITTSSYNVKKDEVLINAKEGDDTVDNEGNLSSIMGGDSNDSINNTGNYVSIRGGTGDDTVRNSGDNASYFYDLGDGNDTIFEFASSSKTVVFGSRLYPSSWTLKLSEDGKDNILTGSGRTTSGNMNGTVTYKDLNGGAMHLAGVPGLAGSRKTFYNYINGSTLTGGEGDDTLENYADNVLFRHFDGDDNDIISLGSGAEYNLIQYTTGDGDDTIEGFNDDDTLKIGDGTGTYSLKESGDDIIVSVGKGSILLVGAASLTSVNISGTESTPAGSFTEDADTYSNSVEGATIQALGGDDTITNTGASVTIDGMGGKDWIYNSGDNVSISGGDGDDSIRVCW